MDSPGQKEGKQADMAIQRTYGDVFLQGKEDPNRDPSRKERALMQKGFWYENPVVTAAIQ